MKRRKIGARQFVDLGLYHRTRVMAVDPSTPMAGDVLDDRQYAALEQPLANRSGKFRDASRLGSVSAVADHRIRPGNRDVEHRQTIDCYAESFEIVRNQPGTKPGCTLGLRIR